MKIQLFSFTLFVLGILVGSAVAADSVPAQPSDESRCRLILIGDSTVKNGSGRGEGGLMGWGQVLDRHFDRDKIDVENRALGGRSSRTYLTEGLWKRSLDRLRPGDFVIMQFGHNDGGKMFEGDRPRASIKGNGDESVDGVVAQTGKAETVHSYGWYLRKYVSDAKAKGAIPIVLSPIPRDRWQDGRVIRSAKDYGLWARQAAEQSDAFFIDLNEIVAQRYEQLGEEKVGRDLFPQEDWTHTLSEGAEVNADCVVAGIRDEVPDLASCLVSNVQPTSHALPDLVVYLVDDLSAADLPIYGGTNIKTPAIDALAAQGMTFHRAFVASPACAPSRAALLTGRMPARNGAEENHTYPRDGILRLPRILNQLGYQTAAFGKVAHGKSAADYGFDTIDLKKEIPQVRTAVKTFLGNRNDPRPLALFVGVSNPHVPWPNQSTIDPQVMGLPPKLLDTPQTRVQRSRYLQEVKDLDAYLGELRELTDRHLSKDKLFVFSSDHGAQFPFGKWTLYDEGIRVPLIVAHPGKIKAGTRTDAMVSWVDLLPTMIEIAGGDIPRDLDGRSFADVLHGNRDAHRERIFATHSGDRKMNVFLSRAIRTDRYKLIWNPHPEFAFTTHIDLLLRETSGDYFKQWTERAKTDPRAAQVVASHHSRPEFELFDLQSDSHEQHNLAGSERLREVQKELTAELKAWIRQQGDELTVFHEPLMLDAPETWVPRRN